MHLDVVRTKQEGQDYSRTMLNKLSKQQHLLLQELERTKRRLRAEISARERRTDSPKDAPPTTTSPGHFASWSNQHSDGAGAGGRPSSFTLLSPSSQRRNKRASQATDGGRGPNAPGARFKRSRNEGCRSPVESDTAGAERPRVIQTEESCRPSPTTRIGMLPVMSSTGETSH